MNSISYPDMLSNTTTNVVYEHDATLNNLKLMLMSDKYSLVGDPYYGTNIKRLLYSQNSTVIKDLIIDDIYEAIINFMPQLKVLREDIEVDQSGTDVFVKIKGTNYVDYQTNMYQINLTELSDT